jgi:hypothetical protein
MKTILFYILIISIFSCTESKKQMIDELANKSSEGSSDIFKEDTMIINWTNSDEYYHYVVQNESDKKEAIRQLIYKTLQLSADKKDWNSIILDKWIFNLGRLIGNIQNQNEAVGMDRGYRVALKFVEYEEGLKLNEDNSVKYDKCIKNYNEDLEKLIIEVVNEKEFKARIIPFYLNNPFIIEICEQGERLKAIDIKIN